MPKYTTGELAKLCGVSVRTVQYYDTRGILVPSELTDGGRRIYSEGDLRKMKIICFLRELDLPIDSIKELFSEKNPENVISLLLDEQRRILLSEIDEKQKKADKLAEAKRSLGKIESFSVDSIADIACIMERRKKLRKLRITMIALGLLMDAIEVSTLMIWIFKGIWLPFAVGAVAVVALGILISRLYYKNTAFICPECHTVFKPKLVESFLARHTPNARVLTCTKCGYHGFAVETYRTEDNENA